MLIKLRLSVAENTAKLKVAQVRLLHASPLPPPLTIFLRRCVPAILFKRFKVCSSNDPSVVYSFLSDCNL